MENEAAERAIVLVPFLAIVGLAIHVGSAFVFALYPFNLDRELKRRWIRILLLSNLALAAIAGVTLSLYLVWGPPGYHVSSDPSHYIWTVLTVVGAHALFIQSPAAIVSNLIDGQTSDRLAAISDAVGNSLYAEDKREARQSLAGNLGRDEGLLRDYDLWEIARYYSDPKLDYPLQDVGIYLLQRLEAARSRLSLVRSPFAELNFVFSITGAAALAGLALAVANS